jgi:NifU-like protein involved in Fe-S cluster formation
MKYSSAVEKMICVAKGADHGPAPIPEEGKWVGVKEIKDVSGLTHGVGWCAPQQGACKLTLNVKDGIIEEALVETLGCSGMTHSASMAAEILPGKTILEALNTDLVCDAINVAMRELFLQIVYGRKPDGVFRGRPSHRRRTRGSGKRAPQPGRHHIRHKSQRRPLSGTGRRVYHAACPRRGFPDHRL